MKRLLALIMVLAIVMSLCACGGGKTKAAKEAEKAIAAIGEVTLDSGEAIVQAEKLYGILTDSEMAAISNRLTLVEAREKFDAQVDEYIKLIKNEFNQEQDVILTLGKFTALYDNVSDKHKALIDNEANFIVDNCYKDTFILTADYIFEGYKFTSDIDYTADGVVATYSCPQNSGPNFLNYDFYIRNHFEKEQSNYEDSKGRIWQIYKGYNDELIWLHYHTKSNNEILDVMITR